MDIIELKRKAGTEIYEKYVADIKSGNKHFPCPLPGHEQPGRKTMPDFRIFEHNGEYRWICTCGQGDVIDFIRQMEGIDLKEAKRFLEGRNGGGNGKVTEGKRYGTKSPQRIYQDALLPDTSISDILGYFNFQRKIILFDRQGIESANLKFNLFHGRKQIIYPIQDVKGEVVQIGVLELDNKTWRKKIIGTSDGDRAYIVRPGETGRCWITEGIEDALTIMLYGGDAVQKDDGIIVTSSAMNFNKLGGFLKRYKKKFLILDNDNGTAIRHSECLNEHGVKRLQSKLTDLKDANDALQEKRIQEWWKSLVEVPYEADCKITDSDEARNDLKKKSFDLTVLPEKLMNYAELLSERTSADPVIILSSILGCASAFAKLNLQIESSDRLQSVSQDDKDGFFQLLYPNLWMLTIAESGAFKTSAIMKGLAIAFKREAEVAKLYKQNKGLNMSAEAEEELEKARIAKTVILPTRTTPQKLVVDLSQGMAGLIVSSEFGGWLDSLERKYNSDLKKLLTELYDCDVPLFKDSTIARGLTYIEKAYIAICGVSTIDWVRKHLRDEDIRSGFFARFLLFCPPKKDNAIPPSLPRFKQRKNGGCSPSVVSDFEKIVTNYENYSKSFRLDYVFDYFDSIHIELYQYVYSRIDDELKPKLMPFLKRWSPYILKIAMLLQTFIDDSEQISEEALAGAKEIVWYAVDSTFHLLENELESSDHLRKRKIIMQFIRESGGLVLWSKLVASKCLKGGSMDYQYVCETLSDAGQLLLLDGGWERGKRGNLKLKIK